MDSLRLVSFGILILFSVATVQAGVCCSPTCGALALATAKPTFFEPCMDLCRLIGDAAARSCPGICGRIFKNGTNNHEKCITACDQANKAQTFCKQGEKEPKQAGVCCTATCGAVSLVSDATYQKCVKKCVSVGDTTVRRCPQICDTLFRKGTNNHKKCTTTCDNSNKAQTFCKQGTKNGTVKAGVCCVGTCGAVSVITGISPIYKPCVSACAHSGDAVVRNCPKICGKIFGGTGSNNYKKCTTTCDNAKTGCKLGKGN